MAAVEDRVREIKLQLVSQAVQAVQAAEPDTHPVQLEQVRRLRDSMAQQDRQDSLADQVAAVQAESVALARLKPIALAVLDCLHQLPEARSRVHRVGQDTAQPQPQVAAEQETQLARPKMQPQTLVAAAVPTTMDRLQMVAMAVAVW
jgi:hypothetical protein